MRALTAFAALCILASFTALSRVGRGAGGAAEPAPARGGDSQAATATLRFDDVPMLGHPRNVANYTMSARLDPAAHAIHGEGTITWTNASSQPVNHLWMHLYLNAFKNEASVFMREPVGGFRGSSTPEAWGTIDVRQLVMRDGDARHDLTGAIDLHPPARPTPNERIERSDGGSASTEREYVGSNGDSERDHDGSQSGVSGDETDARVTLPRDVKPGETITLDVVWDDQLPSVVERTGFSGSFHMVAQWFPKIAKLEPDGTFAHFAFHHLGEFYADYGTYDVTLDVPESFAIGATGKVVSARTEGGRRIERRVQADVHDFAWAAWDKFQRRDETIQDVSCTILFPPGYETIAERELAAMRFALPHFNRRYGPYPYATLTLVHPPSDADEAGGMEYPTLITTGGSSLTPKGARWPEAVTLHEFGHQYFYGLLASHETRWPFLDEGLNSFAEAEALRAWLGPANVVDFPFVGLSLDDIDSYALQGRAHAHDARVAQPAFGFETGEWYGALVYGRTAAALETMRRVFGRERFDRALGVYTRRFRFQHPKPSDLLSTLRSELSDDAAEAFRAAVFDKAWVDFRIDSMQSTRDRPPAGIFDTDGKRATSPVLPASSGPYSGWVLVTRHGTLQLPVDIDLVATDGTSTRVRWDGRSDSTRIPYAGASPLRAAVVDPDHRVIIDQNPANNAATAAGQKKAGARWVLERATYMAELLLGAFAP